jgi:hypothetical protein
MNNIIVPKAEPYLDRINRRETVKANIAKALALTDVLKAQSAKAQALLPYAVPEEQATLAGKQAELQKQQIINKFLPQSLPATIAATKAGTESTQLQNQKARILMAFLKPEALAQLHKDKLTGKIAPELYGIAQLGKMMDYTPQQMHGLMNLAGQALQPKRGISIGTNPAGGISSINIGGAGGGISSGLSGVEGFDNIVVPNTGQTSRGSAGAVKIDPTTGEMSSIPTRQTQGVLQQASIGFERFKDIVIPMFEKGMKPYVGVAGHGQFTLDLMAARLGNKAAIKRLADYSSAHSIMPMIAADLARMNTGQAPTEQEQRIWEKAINPHIYSTQDMFHAQMEGILKAGGKFTEVNKNRLSPVGIPLGKMASDSMKKIINSSSVGLGDLFYPHEAAHIAENLGIEPKAQPTQVPQAPQPQRLINVRLADGRTGKVPEDYVAEVLQKGGAVVEGKK